MRWFCLKLFKIDLKNNLEQTNYSDFFCYPLNYKFFAYTEL